MFEEPLEPWQEGYAEQQERMKKIKEAANEAMKMFTLKPLTPEQVEKNKKAFECEFIVNLARDIVMTGKPVREALDTAKEFIKQVKSYFPDYQFPQERIFNIGDIFGTTSDGDEKK